MFGGSAREGADQGPIMHPYGPFEVRREKTHLVSTRDGVRLSTDLYFPIGFDGPLGTVLERTPYNKNIAFPDREPFSKAHFFASHGFAFAVQDKRGKFESEGEYTTIHGDLHDSDDTISWIAQQPWSNGRIGMIGCSYPGAIQLKAAQSLNPHLAAIIPQSAGSGHGSADGRYSYMWVRGGVVNISMAGWCYGAGAKEFSRPPAGLEREELIDWFVENDPAEGHPGLASLVQDPARLTRAMSTLPVTNILDSLGDCPPTDWLSLCNQPADEWWASSDCLTDQSQVDAPALHINGWHDYGVAETLLQWKFFSERGRSALARENQYVIIGPTPHCSVDLMCSCRTIVGDYDAGDARFDFWGAYLKWYDRWLNDNEQALEGMPRIQYYNRGCNEWRSAEQWPLPETVYTKLYLTSGGRANSRHGDGSLDFAEPSSPRVSYDEFIHDPATPVCSISSTRPGVDTVPWNGGFDRRELETRADVLVYTGEVLEEPVDVTGPIRAILYVSSSALDTDIDVTLVDVFPDGRAIGIYEGVLRLRYRDGYDRPQPLEPSRIYQVEVDMNVTSNTFLPGHRIRIEIASSNFPNHDRNLGTGGDNVTETEWVVATNRIYHDVEHPSHIVLPIIPNANG